MPGEQEKRHMVVNVCLQFFVLRFSSDRAMRAKRKCSGLNVNFK